MTLTDRVVALTTIVPLGPARQVLLPPVRVARHGAVAVARTVRHWELVLEGADPAEHSAGEDSLEPGDRPPADRHGAPVTGHDLEGSDLPVQDWAELSYADAQSRLAACDESDLRTLLDYEQAHGHRPQYTLLLEQKLASHI